MKIDGESFLGGLLIFLIFAVIFALFHHSGKVAECHNKGMALVKTSQGWVCVAYK